MRVLIVIEAANQFKRRATGPGQQGLKEFHHRQIINACPVHGAHAGHEARAFPCAVFQHVQSVFPLTNHGLPRRIDEQVVVRVKKFDFFHRDTHGLGRHETEILPRQGLPAGPGREVQVHGVNQSVGFDAHPLAPIQKNPGRDQTDGAVSPFVPLAFVQRVPVGIGQQDSTSQWAIHDEMPGGELLPGHAARRPLRHVVGVERERARGLKN